MKKFFILLLSATLILSTAGCGNTITPAESAETTNSTAETDAPEPSAEIITPEDGISDDIDAIGKIQTEDGTSCVTMTLPADFAGTDVTQESLDSNAGEKYISAELNDDGSVSYTLTKMQHKTMLEDLAESMEQALREMIDSDEYSYIKIDHNGSFTRFDVTVSGTELNLYDSFGTMAFYMYGGFYSQFSGNEAENVIVYFYDANGNLIETANSDNL